MRVGGVKDKSVKRETEYMRHETPGEDTTQQQRASKEQQQIYR